MESDLLKAALKASTALQIKQVGKKKLVTRSLHKNAQPQLIGSIRNSTLQCCPAQFGMSCRHRLQTELFSGLQGGIQSCSFFNSNQACMNPNAGGIGQLHLLSPLDPLSCITRARIDPNPPQRQRVASADAGQIPSRHCPSTQRGNRVHATAWTCCHHNDVLQRTMMHTIGASDLDVGCL